MKQFTIKGIMLILSIMLVGCVRYVEPTSTSNPYTMNANETEDYDRKDLICEGDMPIAIMEFPSLEAFLNAYLIVRDGGMGDIDGFVSYYWCSMGGSDLLNVAAAAELGTLETLHLPSSIPEDFEIGRIRIVEGFVILHFFHRDDMVSEYEMEKAYAVQRHFAFHFHRDPVYQGEAELFDSELFHWLGNIEIGFNDMRYVFNEPNLYSWVSDQTMFGLYTPLWLRGMAVESDNDFEKVYEIDGLHLRDPYDMVRLTETRAVNLLDADEVAALLATAAIVTLDEQETETEDGLG